MRKIYSFMLALVACIFATNIHAAKFTITINIDDVNRVKVVQNYTEVNLVAGDNIFSSDADYSYIQILGKNDDFGLKSVAEIDTKGNSSSYYCANDMCSIQLNSYNNGYTYKVTSFSYEELRTASCKVFVDNANKVSLRRGGKTVELKDGLNTIKFIPSEKETPFSISGESTKLYKVKLNGEEQKPEYNNYSVTPADGDSITILANFPDVDVPVRFVAGNEASEGFIAEVKVDDVPVVNWADANFTVKLGSTVSYKSNSADYKFDSIVINDVRDLYSSGSADFFVSDEKGYTLKYYAHKYATHTVTINIDNPAAIVAYKDKNQYSLSSNAFEIPLQAGANVVEFNEGLKYLYVKTNAGCSVLTFTDNKGADLSAKVSRYPQAIETTAGAVYTITSKVLERNAQLVVYIDDPTKAQHGGGLEFAVGNYDNRSMPLVWQGATGASVLAQSGYNLVKFDPDFDNPAAMYFYGLEPNDVFFYVNDKKQEAKTTFQLTIADGDVLKAYLVAEPQTYTVTFSAKEGTDLGFSNVVRDVIVPVADVAAPLSVLTGTRISFKLTGTTSVTANDKALSANEDGVYTVDINENTTILAGGEATAIENANAVLNNNVYSLQGVLLLQNATDAQINSLPAGMYIINGKTSYLMQR